MCGGWSSGGRSGGGPSVTQLKARPRPRPGHITTILLQPLQSAAAPQMGRTPPLAPGIMTWSHQTSDDSFTRPRAWPVSSAQSAQCPGPFLSEAWWDYTAASGELGPGADTRVQVRDRPGPGPEHWTQHCHWHLSLHSAQENTVTAVTSKDQILWFS